MVIVKPKPKAKMNRENRGEEGEEEEKDEKDEEGAAESIERARTMAAERERRRRQLNTQKSLRLKTLKRKCDELRALDSNLEFLLVVRTASGRTHIHGSSEQFADESSALLTSLNLKRQRTEADTRPVPDQTSNDT